MVVQWVTYSGSYFQSADIPVYVKPTEDMMMLRLDYLAFYFPRIYFLKFALLRSILSTTLSSDTYHPCYEVAPGKVVECIDMTKDFLEKASVECIDYNLLIEAFFHLLKGDQYQIKKYLKEYKPIFSFLCFMGLESPYLDLMNV
jgi:hypothetical protein